MYASLIAVGSLETKHGKRCHLLYKSHWFSFTIVDKNVGSTTDFEKIAKLKI